MSDKGLGTILANAEARMAELKPALPVSEQQGRERLRAVAELLGHDANKVLNRFDDDGALADLVRTMLNIEPRRGGSVGRPLSDETIATFFEYLAMAREGVSKKKAIQLLADKGEESEGAIKQRIRRGLERTAGPNGIAEIYSMIQRARSGGYVM